MVLAHHAQIIVPGSKVIKRRTAEQRQLALKLWHHIGTCILRVTQLIRLQLAVTEYTSAFVEHTSSQEDDSEDDDETDTNVGHHLRGTFCFLRSAAQSIFWVQLEFFTLPVLRQIATILTYNVGRRIVPVVIQLFVLTYALRWLPPETVKWIIHLISDVDG